MIKDDEVECDGCGGSGYDDEDSNVKCEFCKGTGMMPDDGSVNESNGIQFDKFMDKILVSEGHNVVRRKQEDNPLRLRAARHQDRPANRTVIGPRK